MTTSKKILRCIRLDQSDANVFERTATPGEAAVSGAFLFDNIDIASLSGPRLQAFRNGFLGVESMGWCTLVRIDETDDADVEERLSSQLANGLVREFGAPDVDSVLAIAREEVRYSRSLCDGARDTMLAVQRTHEGESIKEQFHAVRHDASSHDSLKIWEWVKTESD